MTMLEAALQYAQRGWKIFPCQPGLKIPFTGTHGVKDASGDPDLIRSWFTRWPTANIALACGKNSGVYVIDIDVDLERGINGFLNIGELPDIADVTLVQRTPRGGLHALFKCDGEPPRNKNNFRTGVDVRGDGYYILLAPSVGPNGGTYKWIDVDAPITEFPDAFKPEQAKSVLPWEKPVTPAPRASRVPNDVEERAIAYLGECSPASQGFGGHDALLWASRAMVVGFDLDDATALNLLWGHFNPRCNPMWDSGNASQRKDFERKVTEARRTPGAKPRGWLLNDSNGLHLDDSPVLLAHGEAIAGNLLKKKKAVEEEDEDIPSSWPSELLSPPGLVGEICDWINSTAGCYQPILAVGAALTACGALFGRKVKDDSNGRTNIYALGIGHSSSGKDHPSDCMERLIHAAGASKMIGGQVTSDSAIELSLMGFPVKFYCWDEIGHILSNIKQAGGAGGNAHLRTIVPTLMQLYSSSHKIYQGKQKAEGEARRIDQPHVCIWGLTSPDVLYRSISKDELRDGWLGRVVTFISNVRPKYRFVKDSPPPPALVAMVQAWFARAIPAPDGEGNIAAATTCHQILVPTTLEAYKVFGKFGDEAYKTMLLSDKAGDDCQYLWGKALQNARRIALIVAVGRRFDGAEIEKSDAEYGCALILQSIKVFANAIERNISDSQWEAEKQRVFKLISARGKVGISKAELTRKTYFFRDKKARDACLGDLQEGGAIIFGNNPDFNNSKIGWLWAKKHGKAALLEKEV